MGVRRYALQAFRPQGCVDANLGHAPVSIPSGLVEQLAARFPQFVLRAD
jgi:hypothetical protein